MVFASLRPHSDQMKRPNKSTAHTGGGKEGGKELRFQLPFETPLIFISEPGAGFEPCIMTEKQIAKLCQPKNLRHRPWVQIDLLVDPYILNVDTNLFYSWELKGKCVIFHIICQKHMHGQSEPWQILRVDALLLGCPKKHCPAKRLVPSGWRNKLPWMENSFLQESPLSCLRPETRHFPSEVQETIFDRSHKSSSSPMPPHNSMLITREAVVGLVTRTLMTLYTSSSTRCLWRLKIHAACPGWLQLHKGEHNSLYCIFKPLFHVQETFEFLVNHWQVTSLSTYH